MSSVHVVHADALTFDPVDAREFQALITDPPYSEHVHRNITSAGTLGEGSRGWHRQTLGFEALSTDLCAHISRAAARTQGWVLIYSDHESSHLWREALDGAHAEYVRSLLLPPEEAEVDLGEFDAGAMPWERWSQPQKSGDRPPQGFEVVTLAWGRKGSRKTWNGPGSLTSLRHKSLRGEDKHRTEKPLAQALDLVSWFTNAPHLPWGTHHVLDGATSTRVVPAASVHDRLMTATPSQNAEAPVLDLCGGAATFATACALLGRSCVSFELDEEWAHRGAARASGALAGTLTDRDAKAAREWLEGVQMLRDANAPMPRAPDGSDVKTWERVQRRLADAAYLLERL
jgi:hypothetical protein